MNEIFDRSKLKMSNRSDKFWFEGNDWTTKFIKQFVWIRRRTSNLFDYRPTDVSIRSIIEKTDQIERKLTVVPLLCSNFRKKTSFQPQPKVVDRYDLNERCKRWSKRKRSKKNWKLTSWSNDEFFLRLIQFLEPKWSWSMSKRWLMKIHHQGNVPD